MSAQKHTEANISKQREVFFLSPRGEKYFLWPIKKTTSHNTTNDCIYADLGWILLLAPMFCERVQIVINY